VLALGLLGAVPASAQLPASAGPAPDAAWDSLAVRLRAERRAAREARMRLDPHAILEGEGAYAGTLEAAARTLAAAARPLPADSATVFVLLQLLTAQEPNALRFLHALSPEQALRLDPGGELVFWAGVAAFDEGRWARARDCFAGGVAPSLQEHAEWLGVQARDEVDVAAGGEAAVAILARRPSHRFAGPLALRAARHVTNAGRGAEALALLQRALEQPSLDDDLRASLHARMAEAYRRGGDEAGFRREFLLATEIAPGARVEAGLRLEQARRLLETADASVALRVIVRLARARDGLEAYRRVAARLGAEERRIRLGQILEALYKARDDESLLGLIDDLRAGSDPALRRRAALYAGRVWKRRRNLTRLEEAYRAAAETTGVAGEEARRDAAAALWEMGREQEDAERWTDAAATFAELRRRFPDDTNAVDAGVQEGLCLDHAGDRAAARERLASLCRSAPASRIAGPCLWRGLLAEGDDALEYLGHAMGETNPGFYVFRARGEIDRRRSAGATPDAPTYWDELDAGVRDPGAWVWPVGEYELRPLQRGWLDRLERDARAAQGELCFAFGHADWGGALWASMIGAYGLARLDRAAVLRALGDTAGATRVGIEDGAASARYPVAFSVAFAAAAERFRLSPAFLLAVARQESLLDPHARSGAGAQGLMQLMPETARRMANALGWTGFAIERPAENVLLGAAHLAELLDACGGEVPMALAAYNAGLGRARQWRERARDPDDFMERIGFPETRRFVRSVLMHYGYYRDIYPCRPAAAAPQH
jgi:soluble lytic murein transglycosylase